MSATASQNEADAGGSRVPVTAAMTSSSTAVTVTWMVRVRSTPLFTADFRCSRVPTMRQTIATAGSGYAIAGASEDPN